MWPDWAICYHLGYFLVSILPYIFGLNIRAFIFTFGLLVIITGLTFRRQNTCQILGQWSLILSHFDYYCNIFRPIFTYFLTILTTFWPLFATLGHFTDIGLNIWPHCCRRAGATHVPQSDNNQGFGWNHPSGAGESDRILNFGRISRQKILT